MKNFIKDLKTGEQFEMHLLLKKMEIKRTKDNRPYLDMLLADKTHNIEAKMWDRAEESAIRLEPGAIVLVSGTADRWRDNMQLKVTGIEKAPEGSYDPADIVRTVENIDEILGKVKKYLDGISDCWLRKLMDAFLNDAAFMRDFKTARGALSWHNAYIGGLLEHTHEVMFISEKVCSLYPEADRDITLAGAFLHDIGKVFEIDKAAVEQTVEGGLIGHLSLGFEFLVKKISSIDGFPDDLALHLKHGILSHHGEYEQQSPVLPKTLEATIVYHADSLVSQANAVREVIAQNTGFQKTWSNYIGIKSRKYLLTKPRKG